MAQPGTPARLLFQTCPLCNAKELKALGTHDCTRHPLYRPQLPAVMGWLRCQECTHVFTDGHFNQAALDLIFSKTHAEQTPGHDTGAARAVSAPIVETVNRLRNVGAATGRWLDVGFGNGALMTTAEEYGYEVAGIDLRRTSVALMREFGYDVRCVDLQDYSSSLPFDVVSMADVLEHMPYPRRALDRTYSMLRLGGLLFLSMPNLDCFLWKVLDQRKQNPYWGELEHYHNFGRKRLFALLQEHGFTPCHYGVSQRYVACMEVIARKGGHP